MATDNALRKLIQGKAYEIVFWQLASVIVLASVICLVFGLSIGFSVLAGGMAYGLPNLIFVWGVFRFVGSQQVTQFIFAFFIGETIKMFLSAIVFLLIVKYLPVSLLSELIGFIGAIVSFWAVCLWLFSKQGIAKRGALDG